MLGTSIIVKSVITVSVFVTAAFYYHGVEGNIVKERPIEVIDNDYGMTVEEFQKKIAVSKKTVLVYFHAEWCMPCVKLKPAMAELENEMKEHCEVLKIDTDANPKLAEFFEINSLPMFVIYKDGKKSWENIGLLTKEQVKSKVELYKK